MVGWRAVAPFAVYWILASLPGCHQERSIAPSPAASKSAAGEANTLPNVGGTSAAPQESPPPHTVAAAAPALPPAAESADSADVPTKMAGNAPNNGPPQGKQPCERIAILTAAGPLIVDVEVALDGRPQRLAFEERLDSVLEAADTDHDGKSTWKELAANKEFWKKSSANSELAGGGRELKSWTDQFDRHRDGVLQRDEVAAWIGRSVGRPAEAFAVRSSRMYFAAPSQSSRIWHLLDADEDGRLSEAEIDECRAVLATFDDNDDGVITAEEFATLRELMQPNVARAVSARRAEDQFAALHLTPGFAPDRLEYLLTDLYAPQQNLSTRSFPALTSVYEPLDTDGDGLLSQIEVARLLYVNAHLKISVDFTMGNESPANHPRLVVGEHIREIEVSSQSAGRQAVVNVAATRLLLTADDIADRLSATEAYAAPQVRLLVHDQCDAVSELLDTNADGRLGEREIAAAAKTLLALDVDRDGSLRNEELPATMIAAFVRGESPGSNGFRRPRDTTAQIALANAPRWFTGADFNRDGDISRREFLGTAEQFAQLDADGDSFISVAEARNTSTERPRDTKP